MPRFCKKKWENLKNFSFFQFLKFLDYLFTTRIIHFYIIKRILYSFYCKIRPTLYWICILCKVISFKVNGIYHLNDTHKRYGGLFSRKFVPSYNTEFKCHLCVLTFFLIILFRALWFLPIEKLVEQGACLKFCVSREISCAEHFENLRNFMWILQGDNAPLH